MKKLFAALLTLAVLVASPLTAWAVEPAAGGGSVDKNSAGNSSIDVAGVYNYTPSIPTAPAVISVDIVWEELKFTYTEPSVGEWNPATHTYEGVVSEDESGWSDNKPAITFTNHSETFVDISLILSMNSADSGLQAIFYSKDSVTNVYTPLTTNYQGYSLPRLATPAVGSQQEAAPSATAYLGISGSA